MRRVVWLPLLAWGLLATLPSGSNSQAPHDPADEDHDDADIEEEALNLDQLRNLHGRFDQNGDGKVSLEEVMAFAHRLTKVIAGKDIGDIMEEIDHSKDGRLSLEEHLQDIHNQADGGDEEEMRELAQRKEVESAKFRAADENGDQVLEKHELASLFYPETHDGVLDVSTGETLRLKDKDGDGKLDPREFWEAHDGAGAEFDLSEEEVEDFQKLDVNGDGYLDHAELKLWESGKFHTEEAMRKLFEIADKDNDLHLTVDEIIAAREQIAASDAQYHLIEWAEHDEL